MPTTTANAYYPIPGSSEHQTGARAELATFPTERIDSAFEGSIEHNFPGQSAQRQVEISQRRTDLENIFNPQPTPEQSAKMIEDITAYLIREAELVDSFREARINGAA
jgi:hypothetical protein